MASPYFNRQERLTRLACHLLSSAEDNHSHEALHILLYGSEKSFRKQAVYDALSQLQALLESFLALQAFEADPQGKQKYLLQSLSEIQAGQAFQRQWQKAQKQWETYPYRDLSYFEAQYELHKEASYFEATRQRRDEDQHLQDTVSFLDCAYWSARLKFACELLNRQHILNHAMSEQKTDPIEQMLKNVPAVYLQERSIQAYWLIFIALQNPNDESHYSRWIDWLKDNSQFFSATEAIDMYNYAQNYCIRKINQGDSSYLQALFILFEQLNAKNLILDQHGYMDHRKLKNMVTVGLRLGAFEWADEFLHRYKDKLKPEFREDAYRFNLASLRYAQGRKSEVLRLLQQLEFDDVFYTLSAKSLLLKLYYEEEDSSLEFLLENFRLYLHRNRLLSHFQQKVHLNLLRFSRKLYRLREQKGIIGREVFRQRLHKLEEKINGAEEVANRSWLLEQLMVLRQD